MIATGAPSDQSGDDPVASAQALRAKLTNRGWVADGLTVDGSLAALDATMRPIDALTSAGLGWLTAKVQPLQDVLDRLAGNASAIQAFADASQRTAKTVDQVQQQLASHASADTQQWQGSAADRYRSRAGQISTTLQATATVYSAINAVTSTMGGVVAGARTQINTLLTDLVQRLISYVRQAIAAEGSASPAIMAQATSMISSYAGPIADIERKLLQTIDNLDPLMSEDATSGQAGSPDAGTRNKGRIQLALLEQPSIPGPSKPNTGPIYEPGYKPWLPPPPEGMPPPEPMPGVVRWFARMTIIGILIGVFEYLSELDKQHELPPSPGTSPPPERPQPQELPDIPTPQTVPPQTPQQDNPTHMGDEPPAKDEPESEPKPESEPDTQTQDSPAAPATQPPPDRELTEDEKWEQHEEALRQQDAGQAEPSPVPSVGIKDQWDTPKQSLGEAGVGKELTFDNNVKATNPGFIKEGFTQKHYYDDQYGTQYSFHYNPTTKKFTYAKESSSNR